MLPERGMTADDRLPGLVASPEARERLEVFVSLLERWQRVHNLVGPDTLADVWERHIADSAQLMTLAPDARRWLDLGSGAGFPGVVVAILIRGREGARVELVELNQKKCAFLREAVRTTEAPAAIHCERIELVMKRFSEPVDVVTARALAPLATLCAYAEGPVRRGAVALFHKGRGLDRELTDARQLWDIDLVEHVSRGEGSIVAIRRLTRREKGHA